MYMVFSIVLFQTHRIFSLHCVSFGLGQIWLWRLMINFFTPSTNLCLSVFLNSMVYIYCCNYVALYIAYISSLSQKEWEVGLWPCDCQSLRLKSCEHSFKERRKQIAITLCFAKIQSATKICVQYLLAERKSNGEWCSGLPQLSLEIPSFS